MELDVGPASPGLDPRRTNNAQVGHIIEGHFVETIELGLDHLIEGFRPVTDTGGYDWAGCPYGRFDDLRLVQFKGTTVLHERRGTQTLQFGFNAPSLVPSRNTFLLFGRFDTAQGRLADPLYLVPSLRLARVARRHFCRSHNFEHWQFRANVRPDADDMAAPYRVTRQSLARTLFPSIAETRLDDAPRLSPLLLEKGAFFEYEFITRFLEASDGSQKLLKPETDFGRDLLAVRLKPFQWASLAIKGTIALEEGSLHVRIPARTFQPHRRHFILVQHFDEATRRLHARSWLVPSIAFGSIAVHSAGDLEMATALDSTNNRWARYSIPTVDVTTTFMRWMRRPPAA